MKSITVAELRQNPTAALADVERSETYTVTRHRRVIARLVPPEPGIELIPAQRTGGPARPHPRPTARAPHRRTTERGPGWRTAT